MSLTEHLYEAAESYARRALAAYVKGETGDFGLFAGMTVELLLKLRLSMESSSFIASSKHFKSSIDLLKNADDVRRLPSSLKTIGAAEALERAVNVVDGLAAIKTDVAECIAVRNGEAHLALSDTTTLRRLLVTLLRAGELLVPADHSDTPFWGTHSEFATKVLTERQASLVHDVDRKVAAAKQHFRDRNRHLSPKERAAVAEVAKAYVEKNSNNDETRRLNCPACGSDGLAAGEIRDEYDVEYDRDGDVIDGHQYFLFHAFAFDCPSCDLRLDDAEEMELAGLEPVWQDDEVDAQAYNEWQYGVDDRLED